MKQPVDIYTRLKEKFGDAVLEIKEDAAVAPWILIAPEAIKDVAVYLRDTDGMDFDYLMCLSSIHYEKENELGVIYHVASISQGHKIILKVKVPIDNPCVQSVESVWKTADWHEREAFDMVGIIFEGHPDLRRILCPDDWEGYPLRKDYKVQEFYQGIKVPY